MKKLLYMQVMTYLKKIIKILKNIRVRRVLIFRLDLLEKCMQLFIFHDTQHNSKLRRRHVEIAYDGQMRK